MEHGQYTLNVQISNTPSNNSTNDSGLKCLLTTSRTANNIYTPLIFGVVALLTLFIFCLLAQRMKLREYLINVTSRCFNQSPQQECAHSYDLQACPPATTICQSGLDGVSTVECTANGSKHPTMHKLSHIIVPRSKRLLSLDAFRGFGNLMIWKNL